MEHKPKHVQNLYAFGIAFLITALIVGIWLTTLPARFASPTMAADASPDAFEKSGTLLKESVRRLENLAGALIRPRVEGQDATTSASSSIRFINLDALASSTPNKEEKVILIGTTSAQDMR